MLMAAEAEVIRLERAGLPAAGEALGVTRAGVTQKLRELKAVLQRDVNRTRAILQDVFGQITLEPSRDSLIAVLRTNVVGILGLAGVRGDVRWVLSGAGRGILFERQAQVRVA